MHRTTTTATLLISVAVSALSGCMTVRHPPAAVPSAPSPPPAPRTGEPAKQPIVQAPASEALALIEPSHRPTPAPSAARPLPSTTPPPVRRPPAHRAHPHPRPEHHEPRRPDSGAGRRPPVEIPDVPAPVRPESPGSTDVCALGRKYGGWRPDSPEATICDQTYGG
ncbi:hypothetical protein ACFYNL_00260 [Streptomyces sp. NPDC007808]|uniref:hypothetical protein n=1 Tax=Streptomyces sp. NPDC007808 TaxID=3364779 RepID=UPI0036940438